MSDLAVWVVYDHPRDFPDVYVARKHIASVSGNTATEETLVSPDLNVLREALEAKGFVHLSRDPNDDPVILEVWL